MKVTVEKEHDNCRQLMEVDEDLTDITVEDGTLNIYTNTGENPNILSSVAFSKDELEKIFFKFQEVQAQLKTNAQLEAEDGQEYPGAPMGHPQM